MAADSPPSGQSLADRRVDQGDHERSGQRPDEHPAERQCRSDPATAPGPRDAWRTWRSSTCEWAQAAPAEITGVSSRGFTQPPRCRPRDPIGRRRRCGGLCSGPVRTSARTSALWTRPASGVGPDVNSIFTPVLLKDAKMRCCPGSVSCPATRRSDSASRAVAFCHVSEGATFASPPRNSSSTR